MRDGLRRHSLPCLSLLIALGLSVAGCGGDSRATPAAQNEAAAAAAAAPAAVDGIASGAAVASDSGSMPDCGGAGGACCGSCQEKMAQGQPAEKAMAGCPCQRARQARERARQEEAGS